jgi:signal peptidase I
MEGLLVENLENKSFDDEQTNDESLIGEVENNMQANETQVDETQVDETQVDETQKPVGKGVETLYEAVSVFISAVTIILVLFTFGWRFVGVVGNSMLPNLHSGDWLMISQYDPTVKNGDIVVITQPNDADENIVKRVIATGGQIIDIDFNYGYVFVNGEILNEDYINNATTDKADIEFPIEIPKGYVFVMGDNRQDSTDSRSSYIGLIREEYILGKAVYNVSTRGGFVKIG